jgi:hypothetical protein
MQFVCPYCGPIDWNNKYSNSYSYSVHVNGNQHLHCSTIKGVQGREKVVNSEI